MVQRYQTHCIFLLICGLLVAISLLLAGVPDVQAQSSDSCPEGQIWSLNRCTDVEETTCQTGYTYVADHGCVLIEEDDSTCPSGYEMTGGRCQVIGQSCPAGETWRDGSCQTRDEESCPAGKERVNGSCFQITDTVCPVGYSWSDSKDRCDDDDDDDEDDDTGSGTGTGTGTGSSTGSNSYVIPSVLAFSDTTLTVDEDCNVTYTVALKSEPSDDATVTIGVPSNTDLTAQPETLTFTPDNWDEPQNVTVTCAEDDDAKDDKASVSHTVSGVDYECVRASFVSIKVTDNDTKGVTLSESALTIDEGGTGTYTVQLDSEPTGDVGTVIVTINDPTDNIHVTTAPEFLTFTILNWNIPQTVTVTALEEEDAGDDEATVTHSVSGAFYGGRVTAADVTVSVTDNDTRGVTFSESEVTVFEGGTGTYAVQLDTEPTGTVTVTIHDPTDNTDVTTDPGTLTFTNLNWNTPQTVTVTAAEEVDVVDDTASVTHSVSGADYADVSAPGVTLNVTDNDKAGVFISSTFHAVVDVCEYTYSVNLLTQPSGDVTITIGDPSNTDVTADPEALTFTQDNWNDAQDVTVTCTRDDDAVVDKAYVTHSVSGNDYDGFTAPDVVITVYDTDIAGVTLSESSLIIGEGGTGTYTVELDTEPSDTVTVTVHDPTNTHVTTDPGTLAFTPDNWDDPQTVTITVAADDEADDNTATVTHSVSGGDYGKVNVDAVIVTVPESKPTPLPTFDAVTTAVFAEAIADDEGATVTQLLNDHGFPHYLEEAKSALFYAVENESPHAFDALLGHADVDPNIANGNGRTPLFRAVDFGQTGYVRKLLDHSDTDPNVFSIVLHSSILKRTNDILILLLEHPDINPNQQSPYGMSTPLHYTIQYKDFSALKLLLAHPDIDLSIENSFGKTPREYACYIGYKGRLDQILELLEEYEAE